MAEATTRSAVEDGQVAALMARTLTVQLYVDVAPWSDAPHIWRADLDPVPTLLPDERRYLVTFQLPHPVPVEECEVDVDVQEVQNGQ